MRRRISCPECRTLLIISADAEERGRMRCPECETVIDVPHESDGASDGERLRRLTAERAGGRRPRYDDDDDRPRRRRKSSGAATLLWVLLGGAVVLLLVCGGGIYMMVRLFDTGAKESPVPLMQARAGFKTTIVKSQRTGTGPAPA